MAHGLSILICGLVPGFLCRTETFFRFFDGLIEGDLEGLGLFDGVGLVELGDGEAEADELGDDEPEADELGDDESVPDALLEDPPHPASSARPATASTTNRIRPQRCPNVVEGCRGFGWITR
jgi:hypothetical protein